MTTKHRTRWAAAFFTACGGSAMGAEPSLSPMLSPVAPSSVQQVTIAAKPEVTGFQPGGCVGKGATLSILGRNFGTQTGKAVALGGNGIHVDLAVTSWSATMIHASIPNDSRIQSGGTYYIGVEKTGHSAWLSNIDKSVTFCASAVVPMTVTGALPSGIITPKVGIAIPAPGTAPVSDAGASPAPVAETPVTEPPVTVTESTSLPTPSSTASPSAAPSRRVSRTPSGGSLIDSALPPPPQDAPPPPKQDDAVEPGEIVVISAGLAEAQALGAQAQALGFGIKRRTNLQALGFVITVLRTSKEVSVGEGLAALRNTSPDLWADANHRYASFGDEASTQPAAWMGWTPSQDCGVKAEIGLIDTDVDTAHPSLRGQRISARSFLPTGIAPASRTHGTAVAALLVGNGQQEIHGLLPGAQLHAAAVFRQRTKKDVDATADSIVQALDWLLGQKVQVINLSLGGPRNLIVEAALRRVLASDVMVVAAAGNGGPDGPPVYPAKQEGVVAVTAVDAKFKVYARANHGEYIGFAAPGVDVRTAAIDGGAIYVTGTSYAVPFVAAAFAVDAGRDGGATLYERLRENARDLGAPGKDPVFGWGLVQSQGCADVSAVKATTRRSR